VDRFSENLELMSPGPGFLQKIGGRSLSGEEENLAAGQELPDVDGGIDSIHVFHDYVADDQIWTIGAGLLDGSGAAIDRGCCESILIQNDCQGIGDYAFVIHNQHFRLLLIAVVRHSSLFHGFPAHQRRMSLVGGSRFFELRLTSVFLIITESIAQE
jgi:hypothetical protein